MNEKKNYNDYNLDLIIIDHIDLIGSSNNNQLDEVIIIFNKLSKERSRIQKNKERKEKLKKINNE